MSVSLLVVNPNSSQSVTDGLESSLRPHTGTPPGVDLTFYTGPKESPLSINNITDEILSSAVCFKDLQEKGLLDKYDGFLICCCAFTYIHRCRYRHLSHLSLSSLRPPIGPHATRDAYQTHHRNLRIRHYSIPPHRQAIWHYYYRLWLHVRAIQRDPVLHGCQVRALCGIRSHWTGSCRVEGR